MTGKIDSSHFFDDRWEQDRIRHFYFLKTPAYAKLSTLAKHCVLKGHRGTGKTTLLRALDWRERLISSQLVAALGGDAFADNTIGCFLQIKFLPVNLIDLWLSDSSSEVSHTVISTYLRCAWVLEACEAIQTLNGLNNFATLADEVDALRPIAGSFWSWAPTRDVGLEPPTDTTILTFRTVSLVCDRVMRRIRDAAVIQSPSPESATAKLDLLTFNQLVNELFRCFGALLTSWHSGRPWAFRICMDEGEFLSPNWAISVRTLMRETDSPTYLAISVLHELGSETVAHGADISIDDREIVDLDDRIPEQMADLLAGIIDARLSQSGETLAKFKLQEFLGSPDVEDLLFLALKRTESNRPLAQEFRLLLQPTSPANPQLIRQNLERHGAILPSSQQSGSRAQESAGYRKKKTAGYLQILGDLQIARPYYAGWRVAVAMSDNSVRDFMRFLRYGMEAWSRKTKNEAEPLRFLSLKPLSFDLQDQALKELGEAKFESVPQNITEPVQAAALIEASGNIAHELDFHPESKLRRPNATRLVFRTSEPLRGDSQFSEFRAIAKVLRQCASYGYIADLEVADDHSTISFRMNLSLARMFGFSYWKPQYSTALPYDVLALSATKGSAYARSWISQAGRQDLGRHNSTRLVERRDTLPGLDDL
jgi:hypothetical protein